MCVYNIRRQPADTRTQARGATPELRRVADTTTHGVDVSLFAGRGQALHTDGRREGRAAVLVLV